MALQRRAFLLSRSATLSGCTALSRDPTPTERPDRDDDGGDDYPESPDLAVRSSSAERTITVAPGDFSAYQLQGPDTDGGNHLRYDARVVGDGTVDVVVFERSDYDAYADGSRDVPVVDGYTRTGVSETSVREELEERALLLAVDNTELLTPATDGAIEVKFLLEIAEPGGRTRASETESKG